MTKVRRLLRTITPYADESLSGYVIRLTEVNDYDTPSWILQLAGIQDYVQHKVGFSFNDRLNLLPLASLTGIEVSQLRSLIYQPVDHSKRKFGDYLVFGSLTPRFIIRPRSFKICPSCLRETAYVRKIWELTPVTACPIHRCLLLDQCPNCKRRLPYNRNTVSCCTCKFDWRDSHLKTVEPADLATTGRIHALCNLPGGTSPTAEELNVNPLYGLQLMDFIAALFFIASQYRASSIMSGRRYVAALGRGFNSTVTNADIHELLSKAFSTYNNWPENFFSFLDWRREQGGSSKHCKGLIRDFAEYKYALYAQLNSTNLNFIREAFEDYLSTRWHGGHTSGIKRINEAARRKRKYVSFNEAVKLLNVGRSGLRSLITDGRLSAIVRPLGKINMTLIERHQVLEFEAKLEQLLTVTRAKNVLGIDRESIPDLIKYKLLQSHPHPTDLSNPHRYNLQDISNLLSSIKNKVVNETHLRGRKRISFTIALRKFRNHGMGLGEVIKLILDGKISPCAMKVSCGLGGLLFYESVVANYQRKLIGRSIGRAVRVDEAARLLGLQKTPVYFLLSKGLLTAQKVAIDNRRILFVTTKSINKFTLKYVLPARVAPSLRTSSTYLSKLLCAEGVQAVSGPTVDGGRGFIFRRKDLKKIDLEELIDKERRHQRSRTLSPVITLNEASRILGIGIELIQEYVENGILKPYKQQAHLCSDEKNIYFSRRIIENFKLQGTDFWGLVSTSVAASMLNKPIRNFYVQYVHTGRLKKAIDGSKPSKQFFRRQDVEALIEVEEQVIGSRTAAKILNVSMSSIYRTTVSKELKLVSGPLANGYPINLFLRSDVEELSRTRAAFRAECLRSGKTARFSKQPGKRSCPVQEKVIDRIKQVLKGRSSQRGVTQRLDGLALHRQLVREGFKIGTTTVYKVLHKQLDQRPTAHEGV